MKSRRGWSTRERRDGRSPVARRRGGDVALSDARTRPRLQSGPEPVRRVPLPAPAESIAVSASRRKTSEAHLSTQRPQAGQEPWLPTPHVHPCRSLDPAQPSRQGSGQAVGLILPIRDRHTFVALRTAGTRVRRGPLSVVFLDDRPDGPPRVAYAITKRVGSAVVRNRLRRRLRAICADLARSQPGTVPAGALLISAGPEAARRNPDELRNDVVRLLDALDARRHLVSEDR